MLHRTGTTLALTALLTFLVSAFAQDTQQNATPDGLFITTAAQDDIYEIGSSRLALQQGESDAVKNFAQTMIDHHTMATTQLTPIAEELGVPLPADNTAAQQLMLDQLKGLQDAEFDRTYLEQQVLSHKAALSAFTIVSAMAQNSALQTFVNETLPLIEGHYQSLQEVVSNAQ